MPLVQKHQLSDSGVKTRRQNGSKSRGAATPEGKERSRAASLKHGCYSHLRDQALPALSEDPAELGHLIATAYDLWQPEGDGESSLVEQMARLQWRIQRSERLQLALPARHLSGVEYYLREQLSEAHQPMEDAAEVCEFLAGDAARADFYALPGHFQRLDEALGGKMTSFGAGLLELLHRLRLPPRLPLTGKTLPGASSDDEWRGPG